MWPDVFLCDLTGVWSEHGGLSLEGSQEGLAPELGFEVQLEFHQAAGEGKVFRIQGPEVKGTKALYVFLPRIPAAVHCDPSLGRCCAITWARTAGEQTLSWGSQCHFLPNRGKEFVGWRCHPHPCLRRLFWV